MASDLEDALKSVAEASEAAAEASETEETGTEAEEVIKAAAKESEVKDTKGKNNAQDRIRGLSGKVKDLSGQLDSLTERLTERDQEIAKLVDLLEIREKDSKLIEKINELYESGPEDVKATIMKLNNVLLGVEEKIEDVKVEAEAAKEAGDKSALKEIRSLQRELENTKSELENQIVDQKDEIILDKADLILERAFAKLGNEYTEDDRRVLSSAVIDQINWEAIEQDNAALEKTVLDGFKKTVDWFGPGRGTSKDTGKESGTEITTDKLLNVDWGKTKEVTVDGKSRKAAEFSDDAFTQALAEVMRQNNARSR